MNKSRFWAAALTGLTLVSCQSQPQPALAPVAPIQTADSYKLGPGDKIRLIVFGEERLSGEFTVNELGHVSLPLIGEIQAGGSTLDTLSQAVQSALANGFLKNPRVSVEVLNYRPFYILGEIAKPSQYPFTNGLTVTNAVATAGGFTYRANTHVVFIRGQGENGEHAVALTITTPVHPGDTIRIPERRF